jgi:integrase
VLWIKRCNEKGLERSTVRGYEDRSPEMVRRVVGSLGAIFREARRRGMSSVDPTAGIELHLPGREDPRPVSPTKAELQAIIAAAAGRWRPVILVAIFCGLRASELRGLRWSDMDFEGRQISVNQRADAFHKIGRLKSKSGYRSIPMPTLVVNALREWKLLCPRGELGLVFPTGSGNVESHSNLVKRGFSPIQGGRWCGQRERCGQVRNACPTPRVRLAVD